MGRERVGSEDAAAAAAAAAAVAGLDAGVSTSSASSTSASNSTSAAAPTTPGSNGVILATGGYDHTIRFWDASTGHNYRSLQHPDSQVNCLEITSDRRYIAAGGNPTVRLYEVESNTPSPVYAVDKHTSNVTGLGFEKNVSWMYTGSEDGTVKIWDLRAQGFQRSYEAKNKSPINAVCLHPNQAEIITGDQNGVIRVWDLTANRCVTEMSPEAGNEKQTFITSISVALDGSLACAATNSGNCYMWSPLSSETFGEADIPFQKKQAHVKYILKCQISPNLKYLATASADHTVKLWSLPDLSLHRVLAKHQRWVWDCTFSADSAYLVTGSSDQSARLWDLSSGDMLRHFTGHHKAVTAVALNDAPTDLM